MTTSVALEARGPDHPTHSAVLPGVPVAMKIGVVAAAYLFYLMTETAFGPALFGPKTYYWHEALIELITAGALVVASMRTRRPYRGFLRVLAVAMVLLALSAVSYLKGSWTVGPEGDTVQMWEMSYALFLFLWICAWAYLTLALWAIRGPSRATVVVFTLLMGGLSLIYANFYPDILGSPPTHAISWVTGSPATNTVGEAPVSQAAPEARVSADGAAGAPGSIGGEAALEGLNEGTPRIAWLHAVMELVAVMVGLGGVLLGAQGPAVVFVCGMTSLAAFNMAYTSVGLQNSALIDPLWMLGLSMFLVGAVTIRADDESSPHSAPSTTGRSGLSGLLLLLSLGAVIVVVVAGQFFIDGPAARPALLVFVVAQVLAMIWITDYFDRCVYYLRAYSDELMAHRLEGADWREAKPALKGTLMSTGLGRYLDHLRKAGKRLQRDVLFLGPERLNRPPAADPNDGILKCFLVMPFGAEWSTSVHGVMRRACMHHKVIPVRGDDLFTPTDILDDIWQGIHGADFIVADITDRNANVMYELGIAHTIAKPVLILSQRAEDIPIDLATRRVLLYDTSRDDWEAALETGVAAAIKEILDLYGLEGWIEPGTEVARNAGPPAEQ